MQKKLRQLRLLCIDERNGRACRQGIKTVIVVTGGCILIKKRLHALIYDLYLDFVYFSWIQGLTKETAGYII